MDGKSQERGMEEDFEIPDEADRADWIDWIQETEGEF